MGAKLADSVVMGIISVLCELRLAQIAVTIIRISTVAARCKNAD